MHLAYSMSCCWGFFFNCEWKLETRFIYRLLLIRVTPSMNTSRFCRLSSYRFVLGVLGGKRSDASGQPQQAKFWLPLLSAAKKKTKQKKNFPSRASSAREELFPHCFKARTHSRSAAQAGRAGRFHWQLSLKQKINHNKHRDNTASWWFYLDDESRGREKSASFLGCERYTRLQFTKDHWAAICWAKTWLCAHGATCRKSAAGDGGGVGRCGVGGSERVCEVHLSKENKKTPKTTRTIRCSPICSLSPSPRALTLDKRRLQELKMLSILAINARSHVASIQSISRRATSESEWPGHWSEEGKEAGLSPPPPPSPPPTPTSFSQTRDARGRERGRERDDIKVKMIVSVPTLVCWGFF